MLRDIKGYSIQGKIAKGGMGEIYKGIHKGLKKEVILKKLISGAPVSFIERFKREAAIMMEISHPNIVHVFDFFKEDKNAFIVMEYVTGYNLSEIIKQHKKLPVYLAAYIILEIAKGLDFAHSRGIIHRDIKPANVLISTAGDIKLTDFGIAFKRDDQKTDNITKTGVLLGTPAYMSPEQIYSSRDVDRRADIYSLGILFYQMLTGIRPYSNEFSKENIFKIKKGKHTALRSLNKNVPGGICRIIKKMMHPRKAKRYDSIEDVIKVLQPFLTGRFRKQEGVRKKFSTLIKDGDNRVLHDFTFSRTSLLLSSLGRIVSYVLPVLLALTGAIYFFPAPFLQVLPLKNKPGLLNLTVRTEAGGEGMRFYRIYRTKTGDQEKKKGLRIFKKRENFFGRSNLLLFPGKYTFFLYTNRELFVKDVVINSYEKGKPHLLEWNIPAGPSMPVSFELIVTDGNNNKLTGYTLFYKEKKQNSYKKYSPASVLNSSRVYDFKLEKAGFSPALMPGVSIKQWQQTVVLHFVLLPENPGPGN